MHVNKHFSGGCNVVVKCVIFGVCSFTFNKQLSCVLINTGFTSSSFVYCGWIPNALLGPLCTISYLTPCYRIYSTIKVCHCTTQSKQLAQTCLIIHFD